MPEDEDHEKRAEQYDNYEKVKHVRETLTDVNTEVEPDHVEQSIAQADVDLEEAEKEMEDRETLD